MSDLESEFDSNQPENNPLPSDPTHDLGAASEALDADAQPVFDAEAEAEMMASVAAASAFDASFDPALEAGLPAEHAGQMSTASAGNTAGGSLPRQPRLSRDEWQKQKRQADVVARTEALAKTFDQEPPKAIEAEMAVLGAMIMNWRVCGEVVQILSGPEDFFKPSHAAIYEAIMELYDHVQEVDLVQLNQKLIDKHLLDDVGGLDYLLELAESVPSSVSAPRYARLVHEKAQVRRLIDSSGLTIEECYTAGMESDDLLEHASQRLFKLQDGKGAQDAEKLQKLLEQTLIRIDEMDGKPINGELSGFHDMDSMTNGFHKGELIIIAARPSMGKTAFMLNIAEHMSVVRQTPTAVFSLEMGKEQLAQRLLCSHSGVSAQKLRKNELGQEDYLALQRSVGQLADAPMIIDDTPGLSLGALRAKARRMKHEHGIQAIFIDYLQLMNAKGANNRHEEVAMISRGIKALARELEVPIVCLSQVNRAAAERGQKNHRPRMSELRESGAIEQDADVIMMVHREEYYHKDDPEWQELNAEMMGTGEIIIDKQRNGPTGVVHLLFDGATTRFKNKAHGFQSDGF